MVAIQGSTEFGEKKGGSLLAVAAPTEDYSQGQSGGVDKTLLSTLSEDESPRWTRGREKMHP